MSVTVGLQLPFGIQPVNPVPVDAWSGPFTGSPDTVASAKAVANAAIQSSVRFQSMEVRLIVEGISRKFWYRDGVEDINLVEFLASPGDASPGGDDTQVQFNDGGMFEGDANFTFNKSTSSLKVNNLSGSLTKLSDGTSFLVAGSGIQIASGSNGSVTITALQQVASPSVPLISWMENPEGATDGINTTFSLNYAPFPTTSLMFYVNGILQKQGEFNDYSLIDNAASLNYIPTSGSIIAATYAYKLLPDVVIDINWMEVPTGNLDGINYTFTLAKAPVPAAAAMLYVNGVLQRQGPLYDYTFSATSTVTMNYVPYSGSSIAVTYPYDSLQ